MAGVSKDEVSRTTFFKSLLVGTMQTDGQVKPGHDVGGAIG